MNALIKVFLTLSITLVTTSTAQAEDVTICDGISCDKKQIFFPQDKGSGLLDFDESANKLKPADIKPGDEVTFKGAPKRSLDLRWRDLSTGTCLIDPTSSPQVYYKITKLQSDKRNQLVYFVIESENHNNTLKANYVFFDSSDSGAFRKLRKIDCDQTPHLYDDSYIKECTGGSKVGTHPCNYDSFLRK